MVVALWLKWVFKTFWNEQFQTNHWVLRTQGTHELQAQKVVTHAFLAHGSLPRYLEHFSGRVSIEIAEFADGLIWQNVARVPVWQHAFRGHTKTV